jgi:hypothetical protein
MPRGFLSPNYAGALVRQIVIKLRGPTVAHEPGEMPKVHFMAQVAAEQGDGVPLGLDVKGDVAGSTSCGCRRRNDRHATVL